MSNIKRMKDKDGNDIFPVTHVSAVFDDNDISLREILNNIDNGNGNGNSGAVSKSDYDVFVAVKDFGATSDGETDDTACIQAAIDHAEANNISRVVFNAGTYKVSSINVFSNMYIELQPNTHIITTAETTAAFVCENASNVVISGGIISGAYGAITCNECQNIRIKEVTICDIANGINIIQSNDCVISSNVISNINGDIAGSIGINLWKSNNAVIHGNRIDNTGQDSILVYDDSKNVLISNNICTDWNRENDMGRAAIQAYWTDHVTICDNFCYGVNHLEFGIGMNETGIRARDCDYIKIDNNHVKNLYATGIESILLNDTNGKYLQKNVTITNNTVEDAGQYGISSMSTATIYPEFAVISNNIVNGVKWMYTNGSGVGIIAQGDHNVVSSNIVRNVGDIGISTNGKTKIAYNFVENAGVYNGENVGVNRVGIFTKNEGAEILFNTISHTLDTSVCPMKKGITQFGEYDHAALGNILYNNLTMSSSGTNLISNE